MITDKVKSIINSCKTHLQLDTCSQWVEHVFDNENQKVAQAVIQQKRNEIDRVNSNFAKPMLSAVFLFLDDIREPEHAFEYTKQEMFLKQKWEVVRNYNEFKNYIENNGLPHFISFDHDLADTHYTPEPLWTDYNASKEWQEKQVHQEKTGYECAKWLVDYCISNNLKCPEYYCHSMNPVGKDKIVGLLRSFTNSR